MPDNATPLATVPGTGPQWRFFLTWALPLALIVQAIRRPEVAGFGALVLWAGVAAIDAWWPGAHHSPGPRSNSVWHRLVLRLFVPLQFAMLAVVGWVAADASWPVLFGLAFAAGWLAGAQGITFAHELGHSKSRLDRALAWMLMACVGYSHFMVEHYRGHHVRAATLEDPASARFGESLYAFLPRTLSGSLASGWRLERQRLAQVGSSWARSPLLWCTGAALAFGTGLLLAGQVKLLAFWCAQSAVAVLLLETVNYIEHYGLRRGPRRNRAGGAAREPFGMMHAWNADHAASNALLVNLQRHSDHHMHAWKPYATLEAMPQAPQLPCGYAGCLFLALLPPLWYGVMHPRLAALAKRAARAQVATRPSVAH